ncbi:hypothetical protein A7979_00125 [Rothia nasimurium]|uniref:VWFA domain-containing protein n=1 Tax=Rothia nasimurium TaxID=85336 RepID=A0A1Y1RQB5_9MICC|nr:hypothetical protein [Rothia nasimurium]ORC21968.1 hypothetical protein A7979_00125 [Rothia nasimurium]
MCEVAQKLGGQGFDLTIHTVGFKVDEAAQKELECVADATGGEFISAENTRQLADSMTFLTHRELVGYETVGTEFEFADKPEDAIWLGEGRYRTSVVPDLSSSSGDPKPRYYRLAIPENHNAVVTLKAIPNRNSEGEGEHDVQIKVEDMANTSSGVCQDMYAFENKYGVVSRPVEVSANGNEAATAALGMLLLRDKDESRDDSACDLTQWTVENQIYIEASDFDAQFGDNEVQVEVEVQFEPVVKNADRQQLHEEWDSLSDTSLPSMRFGQPSEIVGGKNYAEAKELSSGNTYRDTLVRGEMKFYKLPVEWGQRPVVAIRSVEGETGETVPVNYVLTDPFYHDTYLFQNTKTEGNVEVVAPSRYIEYNNRGDYVDSYGANSRAGNYYFAVSMRGSNAEKLEGAEQPFEISVLMDGEPTIGPDWRPVENNGPEPSDQPILSDRVAPGTTKSGSADQATSDSDSSATDQAADSEQNLANTSENRGFLGNLLIMSLVALLALLIIGALIAVLLLRKNKSKNAPPPYGP